MIFRKNKMIFRKNKIFLVPLLLLLIVVGENSFAADYAGIGGKPANSDPNDSRTESWFVYTLNPGESKQDELLVENNTDESVNLLLYPADSTPSTDGGFALEQFVESRDGVGKWVTLSQEEITLAPREQKLVPFTISIPAEPTPDVGEHTGGILIQRVEPPSESGGIRLLTRVGVRIYVTIPGIIQESLEIDKVTVEVDEERNVIVVTTSVKNTGNVSQNVAIKNEVSNLSPRLMASALGAVRYPIVNEKNLQVLRDNTLAERFEFEKPLWGKLEVKTQVAYGDGKVLTAAPMTINVPLSWKLVILLSMIVAFLASMVGLIALKKYGYERNKPLKKRL
ncbi:MAG: DUF916 domain-containing protein [Candidatus Peregrinibacteria bacterium]